MVGGLWVGGTHVGWSLVGCRCRWVGGAHIGGSVSRLSVEHLPEGRWSAVGGLSVVGGFVICHFLCKLM